MKVHNPSGSKERLFEMFGAVAKVKINEGMVSPAVKQILTVAFEKLKSGALKAEQGGSVEAKMLDNYVGINGYDRDRNMYNFNFKITGEEGDQDGVEMVNDVYLEKFYYQNPRGIKMVELDENELQEFNQEHGTDLFDAIEEYIDIQPKETPDDTVEVDMDENIEVKPDSDPFGGARQKYQDGMGYGDEKPVNPKLRVDAPELKKFVREDLDKTTLDVLRKELKDNPEQLERMIVDMVKAANETPNLPIKMTMVRIMCSNGLWCPDEEKELPHLNNPQILKNKVMKEYEEEEDEFEIYGLPEIPDNRSAHKYAQRDIGKEMPSDDDDSLSERTGEETNYDELAGEKLLQAKQNTLAADLEYAKLAKAYENFLKVKKIEFEPSDVLQKALSAARDLIAEYLQNVKGLDITPEDVQNFFQTTIAKYGNVISEVEEVEIEEPETKKPEGWKDVNGFFQDDGGVMKWTQKPEGDDATTLELPTGEPEDEVEIEAGVEEPSLDPEDADNDGDMIPGGKADDADVATYDPQQILKGMEVEMEHTDDPKVALEIAMDHLEEFGDYYTRLDGMEKDAKADLKDGGMDVPEDTPEELAGHFDEIGNADKELEDAMLGFKTNTPNANKDEQ